jgi:catechol 2,3-dioxygenase-like lactoylglutathione lyase family enzyme
MERKGVAKMERRTERTARALKAHLALNVSDVERSLEFYRRMLGIEPAKVRPGYAKFDVENPPLNLTLNETHGAARGALSHLGIQLATTEDVLSMRRNWLDAGLETRDEMATNCCYALQNKTWVRDPDGNEWEAFVVLEDDLPTTQMCCAPEADAATAGRATATCDATAETEASATRATTTTDVTEASATGTLATEASATRALATEATGVLATGTSASEVSTCCATAAPLTISR